MVFQKPNPFPTMDIYDNVAAGLKLTGMKKGKNLDDIVKNSLQQASLWDEVKDDLHKPGTSISGGQQQRGPDAVLPGREDVRPRYREQRGVGERGDPRDPDLTWQRGR